MFLRICIAIDEEIIAREYIRSDAEFSLATQIVFYFNYLF